MPSTLPARDIDALARGLHADPFAVLGPHDSPAGLIVRVFRPHAKAIAVIDVGVGSTASYDLERLHPDGLFEGIIPGATREAFDYRLRIAWPDGFTDVDDPYRYGPVLTDFDHHLLAEGTHFQRVRQAWRAADHPRHPDLACTSPCGRRTPSA